MPRDYKSRANPKRKKTKAPVPGWVWFIAGLLVGLFFSGLAWLKLLPAPEMTSAPAVQQPEQPRRRAPVEEAEPAPPKPRFDFYTILPEMEVVVPEPEEPPPRVVSSRPAKNKAESQPSLASRSSSDRYMLQMGSFRRYADADRLKASLALVGIRAEIQKVRIGSGETFHRVRSGPYSRDKVNRLRAKLKQNRISSLVIKLK